MQRYPRLTEEMAEIRKLGDCHSVSQFPNFPISQFPAKRFALARPPDRRRAFTAVTIKAARVQKRRPQSMAGDNGIQPRAARSHPRSLTIELVGGQCMGSNVRLSGDR